MLYPLSYGDAEVTLARPPRANEVSAPSYSFFLPAAGETSAHSATTMPAMGQKVHWPPNQCCTR